MACLPFQKKRIITNFSKVNEKKKRTMAVFLATLSALILHMIKNHWKQYVNNILKCWKI